MPDEERSPAVADVSDNISGRLADPTSVRPFPKRYESRIVRVRGSTKQGFLAHNREDSRSGREACCPCCDPASCWSFRRQLLQATFKIKGAGFASEVKLRFSFHLISIDRTGKGDIDRLIIRRLCRN